MATVKRKKKTAAKTGKRSTASSRTRSKAGSSGMKKGARYQCSVCGIAVRIDETCGCADVCDIICCGKQMKPKKK